MIKHIKQRKNECFLNTLAMLTNKPVDEILASAKVISPYTHSWDSFTSFEPTDDIRLAFAALVRKYAPWLKAATEFPKKVEIFKPGFFTIMSEDYVDETIEGRGAVLLVSCNPFNAHICAFEDGVIYDSSLEGPMDAYEHYCHVASTGMLPFKIIRQP